MKVAVITALTAILGLAHAFAQEMTEEEYLAALEEALPGTLMNNPLDPAWQTFGENSSTRVVNADIPGGKAYRVRVKRAARNPYDIAVQGNVRDGVTAGEVLLVAFWARSERPDEATGMGHVQFRLQQSAAPYTGLVEGNVQLSDRWQIHYLSGEAARAFDAGELNVSFNVGDHKQTVDLGQYYVMNMGPGVDRASLPSGSVDP